MWGETRDRVNSNLKNSLQGLRFNQTCLITIIIVMLLMKKDRRGGGNR